MKNKKGFTLIELLAVIVILAIIMVIAVPKILNVIDNSKSKAWDENVALIKSALQTNMTLANTGMTEGEFTTIAAACTTPSVISTIANYEDTTIECSADSVNKEYTFTLSGSNQFSGKSSWIVCSDESGCKIRGDIYTYVGPGGAAESFNPSWKVWIRQDTTTSAKQLCAKFSNGTVCFSRGDYDIHSWDIVSNERYTALIQKFTNAGASCNPSVSMTCSEGNLVCKANDHGYNSIECSVTGGNSCIIDTSNNASCN